MSAVTRLEIAILIEDAFGSSGLDRSALLATAVSRGASPLVLEKLGELPDQRFRAMRELWTHIPEVPVG